MAYLVGVDTGGTFTDLVLFDTATQHLALIKYPSTPEDPSEALVQGLLLLLEGSGASPAAVAALTHGTTVGTNAVLEGRLPEIGMLTTAGFRDVLELARQRRPHLYNLDVRKPRPVAPRRLRLEVPERLDAAGRVVLPLEEGEVERAARALREAGVPAVAICFLHAYRNPRHERRAREVVRRAFPQALVSLSSEVLREFREFERFSTTAINAALMPVVSSYLQRLESRLRRAGVRPAPRLSSSYGGTLALRTARRYPVAGLVSGPSAGVVGAAAVAQASGFSHLITLDMGGTSTDVCLVRDGVPLLARERSVSGWPVITPSLDVHSVGAGGGSVVWVDQGGFLQVGPRSAGARPGPACYGLGGTDPTVTDTNLLAGRQNPRGALADRLRLFSPPAEAALEQGVLLPLGFSKEQALRAVFMVLTSNLVRAVRVISVERGYDPRDFTLVAFGGAGPMHGPRLAREVGIARVLVPESPGVLCALGLLMADIRAEFSQSHLMLADRVSSGMLSRLFAGLEQRARRWLRSEGIDPANATVTRLIEARYVGQGHQVPAVVADEAEGSLDVPRLVEGFHQAYQERYGYSKAGDPVELVHFRVQVQAPGPRPELRPSPPGDGDPRRALVEHRPVFLEEEDAFLPCPVYRRASLVPGDRLEGPAIVEQMDATTVLLPGQTLEVDPYRNLIVTDGRVVP